VDYFFAGEAFDKARDFRFILQVFFSDNPFFVIATFCFKARKIFCNFLIIRSPAKDHSLNSGQNMRGILSGRTFTFMNLKFFGVK
jgi:hypothetical protein